MNRAYVKYSDGRIRPVKNLGWILRNWKRIERLEWINTNRLQPGPGAPYTRDRMMDGCFRAYMRDGSIYATEYASFAVWCRFVNRPVFRDLPCTVNGIQGQI